MAINNASAQEQINQILDRFDFDKAQAYMQLTGWQWRHSGVPTVQDLKWRAVDLLNKAAASDKERTHVSTGGLMAIKLDDKLGLSFMIEYKSVY